MCSYPFKLGLVREVPYSLRQVVWGSPTLAREPSYWRIQKTGLGSCLPSRTVAPRASPLQFYTDKCSHDLVWLKMQPSGGVRLAYLRSSSSPAPHTAMLRSTCSPPWTWALRQQTNESSSKSKASPQQGWNNALAREAEVCPVIN